MHGFKSFAKRTHLTFEDNFSVILGPNGSGKSNVLDALCFVLGRMSSKSLRSEKMGHLIYNGGKNKDPATRAEVSIFFDNTQKIFPVESDELKVSRLIKPNGQSIYKINDENRTRQQVIETLGLARIDPNGHNIILQGDIVNFVEMPAENRRMLLEEVAGISVYEERKKKALNEMGRVEERLRESDILLGERKQHLKELRKDRDQASKYKELHDKMQQHRATYTAAQLTTKEKRQESITHALGEQQKHIDALTARIEKNKARVEERKEADAKLSEQLEKQGEAEELLLNKEIEQIRVDIGTAKNKIELFAAELGKIVLRREQLFTEQKDIEEKANKGDTQQQELTATTTKQQEALDTINRRIGELTTDKGLEDVAVLEKEITEIEKTMEAEEQGSQTLVEQKQVLLREKDRLEIQLENFGQRTEKIKILEKEQKIEMQELKTKQTQFRKVVVELNKELNHNSTLATSLGGLRKKQQQNEEELAKIRARLLLSQERSAASKAVQYITTQKDIAGVYGTIANLGTVQSEYAQALEAAAGSRINSVIVKDDAIAAKCIVALRQKKTGTATFLPLNKIKSTILKEQQGRGIHGTALKLVSFESQYKNAFAHVFGNTMVVDTLDVARRIGVGSQRMVTLEGDVVELSGAMQGGYRKTRAGVFQEQNTVKHHEKTEKELSTLQENITKLEQSKAENEEHIATLRAERGRIRRRDYQNREITSPYKRRGTATKGRESITNTTGRYREASQPC